MDDDVEFVPHTDPVPPDLEVWWHEDPESIEDEIEEG